jgi:predicted  nucleic acid-binding Zn-ribbon protein
MVNRYSNLSYETKWIDTLMLENLKATWKKLNENRFKLRREIDRLNNEKERLQMVKEKLDLEIQVKALNDEIEEKRRQL